MTHFEGLKILRVVVTQFYGFQTNLCLPLGKEMKQISNYLAMLLIYRYFANVTPFRTKNSSLFVPHFNNNLGISY